jgi:uncharacterized membrane protein
MPVVTIDDRLEELHRRLVADQCEINTGQVGGRPALVGHRAQILPQMMFSRIHLYTVAAGLDRITGDDVRGYTSEVSRYVKATSGSLRGVQSGIAAFAVLVDQNVTDDAVEASRRKARIEFAVRVQPVVIDAAGGAVHTNRKGQVVGFLMNGHLRRKMDQYFFASAVHTA